MVTMGSMRTKDQVYSLTPFQKNTLSSRCHGTFISLFMKTSFMQNSYYTDLEPPSSLGLYRPTKLASTSYSVSLCCCITCFRRGRHRAHRWVLRGRRRIVRGAQVVAWDRGTSWQGFFMCRPLRPYIWILLY